MEKILTPELLQYILGILIVVLTGIIKFVYDTWKEQNKIKHNYISRFEEARKDAEHIHTNLDSKIESVKGIFDEKFQFLSESLEHNISKIEDKIDSKLDRIMDRLDEQDRNVNAFWKEYGGSLKTRSKKDV